MYVGHNGERIDVSKPEDFEKYKAGTLQDKTIYKIPGDLVLNDSISLPQGIIWCFDNNQLTGIRGNDLVLDCAAIVCADADFRNSDIVVNNIYCENIMANEITMKERSSEISLRKLLESSNIITPTLKKNANSLDFYLSDYNIVVGMFDLFNKHDIEITNKIEIEDNSAEEIVFYGGNIIANKVDSLKDNSISLLAGNFLGSGKFNDFTLLTYSGTSYNPSARNAVWNMNLFGNTDQNFGTAICCLKLGNNKFNSPDLQAKMIEEYDWSPYCLTDENMKQNKMYGGYSNDVFSDVGYLTAYNVHCKNLYAPIVNVSNFGLIEDNLMCQSLFSNHGLSSIYTKNASFDFGTVYSLNAEKLVCKTLQASKEANISQAIFNSNRSVILVPTFNTKELIASNQATILCDNKNEINFVDYNKWAAANKGKALE